MQRLIDANKMLEELKPITYDMEQNAVTIANMSNIMCNWVMRQPTIASTQWTRVEDDMPPEYDSMFKKFKGTSKWLAGMYETISDDVNVVVKFEDGTKKVYTLHTTDGMWGNLPIVGKPVVTHWAPLPSLPEEEQDVKTN